MKAIIVDDELLMMRKFERLTEGIDDLNLVGKFEDARAALAYMEKDPVSVAFLDIEMPIMDGITLAQKLREIRRNVIIVFINSPLNEFYRYSCNNFSLLENMLSLLIAAD